MAVTGIIAEFNPLHKGHEYLLKQASKKGEVVCALSGNFVQRGETAIAEKRVRAEAALNCGANLVIELPVLWSMSTAQNFALGAVSLLKNAGCDSIMFGSECGDIKSLEQTADILLSEEFSLILQSELKKGVTFAVARQVAAEKCGAQKDILKGANNNLAIEYILAAKNNNIDISFETVKRKGAAHDSKKEEEFVSASFLREAFLKGDYETAKKYMPKKAFQIFKSAQISDIKKMERGILAILRTKAKKEFENLPDLSEGVENKIFKAITLANSLEELYNMVKVKRYTLARIRRLVLAAFIGADNEFFMKTPPYIRILGFDKKGQRLLKEMPKCSKIPIIKKVADIKMLDKPAQKVFETECRATDLFMLSLPQPLACGLEYTTSIIKVE